MSFSGQIEDFSVVDILQYVAAGQRTGKLHFENSKKEVAELYFHEGQCVRGMKPGLVNIGNVLLKERHVSSEDLLKAIEIQRTQTSKKPLGVILEEMNLVTHEMIRQAVVHQIEEVMECLLGWPEGSFEFEQGPIPSLDDIGVTPDELALSEEVNTVYLLMDAVRHFDEASRDSQDQKKIRTDSCESVVSGEEGSVPQDLHFTFSLLKVMLLDMSKLDQGKGIAVQFLNVLSEHVSRAILFVIREDFLRGLGGFGAMANGQALNQFSRRIKIPLSASATIRQCLETRNLYQGLAPNENWIKTMYENIGSPAHRNVLFLPVSGMEKVTSIVYADNGSLKEPIQNTDLIEMAAAQTGVMIENVFLRKQMTKLLKQRQIAHPSRALT